MFNSNRQPDGVLARIDRDLENLKNGLTLLGVKPCCCCGTFFHSAERSHLFDCGELVCLDCIHEWWTTRSPELDLEDREIIERKLVNWLVNHHRAQVIRKTEELIGCPQHKFRLIVSCARCDGSSLSLGKRCPACDGRGTICLAISK